VKAVKILPLEMLVVLSLFGCSANGSQTSGPTPTAQTAIPSASPMSAPPTGADTSNVQGSQKIPVTWGSLSLKGKLVYPTPILANTSLLIEVQTLDLSTGNVTTVFQAPAGGWVDAAMVSPDGKQLLLSYQPPPGTEYGTLAALYVMPLDGSQAPAILFAPGSTEDRYYQPGWSPDGRSIYYTHATYGSPPRWEIMRMAYPNGKPEKLADHAYWPSLSPDGKYLVFVSIDPSTGNKRLFRANADGTQASEISVSGPPSQGIVGAPIFLPGNQSILFSAPSAQQALEPNWAERLLGITVAFAQSSAASEWWVVPATGGAPTQLTQLHSTAFFASLSPDGQYVASFNLESVAVMKLDGTNVTQLMGWIGGIPGTVSWAP
jgi:Tol biopolymer transport system component